MRARDHTDRMLAWWQEVGIDHADLALRRPGDVWVWHRAVSISQLPRFLPWARAENVRRAEVYARPARGSSWPVVFLDDLQTTSTAASSTTPDPAAVRTQSATHAISSIKRSTGSHDSDSIYPKGGGSGSSDPTG